MEIKTLILGDLQTNCYLVWDELTRDALVIDPADDGGYISEKILENKLELRGIILTHGHFDHVLGLLELELNFPGVRVYLNQADLFLIKQTTASARHWLKRQTDPVPLPQQKMTEGQVIKLGGLRLRVVETPGHTPGSICLYTPGFLFTGDTLFKEGIGRTDLAYSNFKEMQMSLQKIFKLPQETVVLPGHGEQTTIGEEIK